MTSGEAIGMCPPHAREGDSIVTIFGCRISLILRRKQNDVICNNTFTGLPLNALVSPWEFIGECYVHGLMDGEATKNKRESGAPVQTFTLW